MKPWVYIAVAVGLSAGWSLAQGRVTSDQGRPGKEGSWPVSVTNTPTISGADGGYPLEVMGPAAAGSAVSGNPLMCGGSDGTNARRLLVDTGGRLQTNLTDDTDVAAIDSNGNVQVSLSDSYPPALDLATATIFDYDNCASGGSASQTVTTGTYLLMVGDEDVFVCYAATCAADGRRLLAGKAYVFQFDANQDISCRSTSSTGDLEFTLLQQ